MAAVDYFLKIDGIEGESHDHKHKGEIQLESFSWGEKQQGTHGTGGGGGAGKVQVMDLHFAMHANKSSPKLMLACASGGHLKSAVLSVRKAGGKQLDYYLITLTDVLVSSYTTGGTHHGDMVPLDQITLNFSKIEMEYKEQKPDGTLGSAVKAGWDVKANAIV